MSVLDSLPARPLTDAELTTFNRSDALELAVDAGEGGEGIDALLLVTDDWVKGLVHDDADGGWRVVETVPLGEGEDERFDAMRACEDAVRDALA